MNNTDFQIYIFINIKSNNSNEGTQVNVKLILFVEEFNSQLHDRRIYSKAIISLVISLVVSIEVVHK